MAIAMMGGVTQPHRLSRRDARRIAVRAQLLTAPRPDDVLNTVLALTMVQVEPTDAVAPSADVVLWSRLGPTYDPVELCDLVDQQRLVELRNRLLPAEDLVLHRAEMAAWPGAGQLTEWQVEQRDWVEANGDCHHGILERLRGDGPLPSRELPDTCVVPWNSSGWNDNRDRRMMIDLLVQRGEIAAAGYDGRERLWDLAERVYPDAPPLPLAEARRERARRELASLGIARSRLVDDAGEPAVVDGVRGRWRVDPDHLRARFRGRTALLSPLDRLVYDRKRTAELFEFEYQLEMYKPATKRRWGYWALRILHGDRLVGKLDATADREAGELRVDAVHRDSAWPAAVERAVDREIAGLARWLGLGLLRRD